MITGMNPSDSNPYATIKESNINLLGLSLETHHFVAGNPWRHAHHPYTNPYVYDPATAAAVALAGVGAYSPYSTSTQTGSATTTASGYSTHMDLAGRRKNATRETTATLKAWLYEHRKNPYPTKSEKVYLAIMTKMTLTQVSTWFANARRRLKKENKMTWSPRNRTNEDDDDDDDNDNHHQHSDRHGLESTSDAQSDDDEHLEPSAHVQQKTSSVSSTLSALHHHKQTSFMSNLPYLTNSLNNVMQHMQPDIPSKEETSRKRKFDQVESVSTSNEKKRSSAIWSLAEMAEKSETKKCQASGEQIPVNKQRLSSSSSCSSTTSVSLNG